MSVLDVTNGTVHVLFVLSLQPKENKDLIDQVARLADTVTVSNLCTCSTHFQFVQYLHMHAVFVL